MAILFNSFDSWKEECSANNLPLYQPVLDFEVNQIEISIDGIYRGSRLDFSAMSSKVREELEQTLGTTVREAVSDDPIQRAISSSWYFVSSVVLWECKEC